MLVCHVSQLARRAAISASLSEAAAALDAVTTGAIFAALIDEPAAVTDHVDAYTGSIMSEAASASATVNAGLIYVAAIAEAVTALDTVSVLTPAGGVVTEAASAVDVVDASIVTGISFGGVLALDGPIMPQDPQPTVILAEG